MAVFPLREDSQFVCFQDSKVGAVLVTSTARRVPRLDRGESWQKKKLVYNRCVSKELGEIYHATNIHPDYQRLLVRYLSDPRFIGAEDESETCINYLLELNEWVQTVKKPPEIQAILLTGSLSHFKEERPDLNPIIDGPRWNGAREGGSDIDVLCLYRGNIGSLLKLKWLDMNIPERELVHPDDFVINARNYFRESLKLSKFQALSNRIELHVAVLTPELAETALKKYVRYMIRTGTLIWGSLNLPSYGTHRDTPLHFKRPSRDPIIEQMAGGF